MFAREEEKIAVRKMEGKSLKVEGVQICAL